MGLGLGLGMGLLQLAQTSMLHPLGLKEGPLFPKIKASPPYLKKRAVF